MLPLLRSPLHHSEAIDPTLAGWIRDEIDRLLGLEPAAIATLLGLLILAFPVWLGVSASRHRHEAEPDASVDGAHDRALMERQPPPRVGARD
ncbi:MAG: hypothetical protein AB7F65_05275 [Dehalococcoidia bacterium]